MIFITKNYHITDQFTVHDWYTCQLTNNLPAFTFGKLAQWTGGQHILVTKTKTKIVASI